MERTDSRQSLYCRVLKNYALVFDGLIALLFILSAFTTEYYRVHNAKPFVFWFGGTRPMDGFMREIFWPVFIFPVIALVCRIMLPRRKILLNGLEGIVLFLGLMATVFMMESIGDNDRDRLYLALGELFMATLFGVIDTADAENYKTHFGVSPFFMFGATGLAVVFTLVKLKRWWIRKRENLLIQKRKKTAVEFSAE